MNVNLESPSQDIKPSDWLQWYCEIQTKLQKVKEENKKVEDDINKRFNRYQEREGKYRQTINNMQRELRVRLGYEKNAKEQNDKMKDDLHSQILENIDNINQKTEILKKE